VKTETMEILNGDKVPLGDNKGALTENDRRVGYQIMTPGDEEKIRKETSWM